MRKGIGKGGIPIEERLQLAEGLWIAGFKKWQILTELQNKYGISRSRAIQDLDRMRARLGEEAQGISRQEKRDRVGDALLDVVRTSADQRMRLKALEQYAKLYALDEHPDQNEEPVEDIEIVMPDWRAEFQRRLEAGEVLTAGGNGSKAGSGGNGSTPPGGRH